MRIFRVGFTGDFLNERGETPSGDIGQRALNAAPFIQADFIRELAPSPNDPTYYDRFYSLQVQSNHIANLNGLIILRPWLQAEALARGADNLVVVGRFGVGCDKIDIEGCTAHDVALFNAPDSLTHSTASAAFLFMLALSKRLTAQQAITRRGRWDLQFEAQGSDLPGKTLGIIGLGNTGRELARLASPWRMRLLAYSPHAAPQQAAECSVELVGLDELLRESDFVSFHCRLTPATRGFFRARELSLMKPTAYLINVARGELLDQAALVACLRERRIAGAGLDVYEHEPLAPDDPLIHLDNVILTPHWLPATRETTPLAARAISHGMLRAAQGLVPETVVNRDVLERAGFQAKLARFAENRTATLALPPNNEPAPPFRR